MGVGPYHPTLPTMRGDSPTTALREVPEKSIMDSYYLLTVPANG